MMVPKDDKTIIHERDKKEQSEELTLLQAMAAAGHNAKSGEETNQRKELAISIGLKWGEYKRIVRKYSRVLNFAMNPQAEFDFKEQIPLMKREGAL